MKKFLILFFVAVLLVGCTVNVQLPPTVTATSLPPTATATSTPLPTATPTVEPTATSQNIVDRTFFVESQLMKIHFKLNIETGDYDVSGVPADTPAAGDEVLQTQYDLLIIYDQYGYYEMNAIDHVMGTIERKNFESVQALNRAKVRQPWHHKGNLNDK